MTPGRPTGRHLPGSGPAGFTLVETLVAMTVLAVVGSAIVGTLTLALTLLRSAAEVLASIDGIDAAAVCGALAVPAAGRRASRAVRRAPGRSIACRLGVTLVEVLVVLAIVAVLSGVVVGLLRSASGGRAAAEARLEHQLVQHGLALVLQAELGRAGSGLPATACGLSIATDGRTLDLWWRQDDEEARVTLTAGADAAGRAALYRRRHPHARQPWLEDVAAFAVVAVEPAAARVGDRVWALVLEASAGASAPVTRWQVELPHRPCLREVPP